MDLKKPKIYGDRLMLLLAKVNREMEELEKDFILDERLSYHEDDVQNYARIRRSVIEIHKFLEDDVIRGESGMEKIAVQIFDLYEDLCNRIIDSNKFPEFNELYLYKETHY